MQENIQRYHPLGPKTLFMFILKRTAVLFFLVPILLLGLFSLKYVPFKYLGISIDLVWIYFAFLIIVVAVVFFLGWLEYFRYWIFVDDKDLKIARGLIAIEQIGIPYRHIKDVKIKRSLLDQIVGVSDIIITVLGDQENASDEEENIIILPSLSKEIGLQIQDIVLKKAQVEQINILSGQKLT